jgi:hypothetical protein
VPVDDSTDLGPNAYAAYGRAVSFRTHDGHPMPMWEALGDTIQNAWRAVANEIVAYLADAAQEAEDQDTAFSTLLVSEPQRPSLGRTVLVGMDPAANNGSDVAPAVITRVWSDTIVNLTVFPDGGDLVVLRWTSATYAETLPVAEDDPNKAYRWTWPPRV